MAANQLPPVPFFDLARWCIEDTLGPLTVLTGMAGILLFVQSRFSTCARGILWSAVAGTWLGGVAFYFGLTFPGWLLAVIWLPAAFDASRSALNMWRDLRNQALDGSEAIWAKWTIFSAIFLLGMLFLGDLGLGLLSGRTPALKTWTSLTLGAAGAGIAAYLSASEKTQAFFSRIGTHQQWIAGSAVLVLTVLVFGVRGFMWFVSAHEVLGGQKSVKSEVRMHHLAAMQILAELPEARSALVERQAVVNATQFLDEENLAEHLHLYASPRDQWPKLIGLGGRLLNPETPCVCFRIDSSQRRFLTLHKDGLLLRTGFIPGRGAKVQSVQVWDAKTAGNTRAIGLAFVPLPKEGVVDPRDPKDDSQNPGNTKSSQPAEVSMQRTLGEPAGIWDTVFVLRSDGLVATVGDGLAGTSQIPMPENTECRDLVWHRGIGLMVLLNDGSVWQRITENGVENWSQCWPPVENLKENCLACGLAPLPDGSGAYVLDVYGGIHPQGNAPIQYHMIGDHRDTPHYFYPHKVATRIHVADTEGRKVIYGDHYGGVHGIWLGDTGITYTGTRAPLEEHGWCRDFQYLPELQAVAVGLADGSLMMYPATQWLLGAM